MGRNVVRKEEFPAHMAPEAYKEALDDLTAYLERGASPVDKFATIAVEQDIDALLFVHETEGEIRYRGIIDWVGLDLDQPNVVHVVDYKSNRFPPSQEQVKGDVQLKGYAWLVLQNLKRYMPTQTNVRVVVHLDAIKFRDVDVEYTAAELDDWHSWAVAVIRGIIRDEKGLPVLNDGCGWCPVKGDCSEFQSLPATAKALLGEKPDEDASLDDLIAWRDMADRQMKLLEKGVKQIDERVKTRALRHGETVAAGWVYAPESDWATRIDARGLHQVLGDAFYDVISVGKGKVEALTKQWPTDDAAAVIATFQKVVVGTKVSRKKKDG